MSGLWMTKIRMWMMSLIAVMSIVLLSSCEERTGYLNDDQKKIISVLTDGEWKLTFEHAQGFEPRNYDEGGWIYKFSRDGSGWRRWVVEDVPLDEYEPQYFKWSFTNENLAVIYLGGTIERYWLLDNIVPEEMQVYDGIADPVYFPSDILAYYKFVKRK